MSHKTLVNGTVYEVGGGKTLIDGVAYSIDKGKTLVGGTAYEVGFAKPATITLTGSGSASYAEYNGTQYKVPTTFEADVGDTINLYCGDVPNSANIVLNGTGVSQGLSKTTYEYTVVGNATIEVKFTGSSYMAKVYMYITEE